MATLLRGGRVFDSVRGEAKKADVLIEGANVSAVGSHLTHEGATVVDATGMTILPGLIDLHEHLTMKHTWGHVAPQLDMPDPYLVMRGVRASLAVLKQGITTVRELAAKNDLNIYIKRAIDAKLFPGPRVLAAGSAIVTTGGHSWRLGVEADGADAVRLSVRERLKAGADWIKLLTTNEPIHEEFEGEHVRAEFSLEELTAAAETAHAWGRKITAHASGHRGLRLAIDAGVDSIEHGIYLDRDLAKRLVDKNIALIPTLSSYQQNGVSHWGREPELVDMVRTYLLEPHKASVLHALREGVTLGIGTDTIGIYMEELEMLMACGMTHGQVLSAATLVNARILGLAHQIGSVEPGKIADLAVVRGDPLSDIQAMRSVEWVFQSGIGSRPAEIQIQTSDETADWNSAGLA